MPKFLKTACSILMLAAAIVVLSAASPAIADNKTGIPGLLLQDPPQKPAAIVFYDTGGKQFSLRDFRGKLLLVNLWATWCVPCVKEMPSLSRLQAAMQPMGLEVLAINQDRNNDLVPSFYDKLKIANLKLYTDSTNVAAKVWNVPGLPASFIIDESGKEIARLYGSAEWDSPQMMAFLQNHLPTTITVPHTDSGM